MLVYMVVLHLKNKLVDTKVVNNQLSILDVR